MQPLFKAARRPLTPEWERVGLDEDGWRRLHQLTNVLLRLPYFEHLEQTSIREQLRAGLAEYRAAEARPQWKVAAAELLDSMAVEPMRRTVYLGVENLTLPDGTVLGEGRFVDPRSDAELSAAFWRLGADPPTLVCEIRDVVAGTSDLVRERARDAAETALALVRQLQLFGFNAKIYLSQVRYRLDGRYVTVDEGGVDQIAMWRAQPMTIHADLNHANLAEWRQRLAEVSQRYLGLPSDLRVRVDTCLGWLDVAAMSERWRIIIPAVFSGMEALLVPESHGLKAEVVTVRSVAVHVALGRGFFDPGEIMAAYRLRNALVHGAPTAELLEKDVSDFADFRRRWAFGVLCDYLDLATSIGCVTVEDLVAHLDTGACRDVCTWLEEHGGGRIVDEYRKVVDA
jgi:hypothetical protein